MTTTGTATRTSTVAVMLQCGPDFIRMTDAPEAFNIAHGHVPCPACGRKREHRADAIRGTHNPDKTCSARCRNARRGDCECECAGEHHGVDRAGAFG